MNTYYITDQATHDGHIELFHPQLGSHYINLPKGKILVSCHFPENHSCIETWEAHPNVKALPHPVFEGTKPLSDAHVAALSSLGIVAGNTILDIAKVAASIHPGMKLRHI